MSETTQTVPLVPDDRAYSQQNTTTLQAEIRRIMERGGTIQLAPNARFWINALTVSPETQVSNGMTVAIEGNGSTLLCNTNNVERYFEIRTDGFLWNEHGRVIVNNLNLVSQTAAEGRDEWGAGNGFAFENLCNVDLEVNRCTAVGFRSNVVLNWCWPVTMNHVISRKGKYLLDVLSGTTSRYNRCQFIEGRYGVVIASSVRSAYNQHFVGCRFETLRCLGLLPAPAGEQAHETRFVECYIEDYGRPLLLGLKLRPSASDVDPMSAERDFLFSENSQYRYLEPSGGGVRSTWFVGNYWTQSEFYKQLLGNESWNHWSKKWFPEEEFGPDPQRPVVMPECHLETNTRG